MGVGSAARGGDERPSARGGVVFDLSGGGRKKLYQGGIGGGTKAKISSGRLRRPKFVHFLLVLEQNFKFFAAFGGQGGVHQYIMPFLRGGSGF